MARLAFLAAGIALIVSAAAGGYALGVRSAAMSRIGVPSPKDHEDLRVMYEQDQRDRSGNIDWTVVDPRDRARRVRVTTLVADGALSTANDYYHAAMILQHGDRPDDFLLAHELAVAAAIMGQGDAAWLAAAAEDRFLRNTGRPQRFGTQFRKDADGPWYLEAVDATVPDTLRRAMNVPKIAESASRVAELNKTK